jgi:UDP-glucose 4-epimerase
VRLLVTGGAGYIGSVAAAKFLGAGHEVTVLDNLSTGHRDAVPDGAEFVEADLLEPGGFADALARPYDGVVHFAAKSLVGESVEQPALYYRNNVVGTLNLVEAMRAAGLTRLVFSSTAATYGEPDEIPIREDAPTRPTNPYGASKLAIDQMLRFSAPAYGTAPVSLRYFNVAGAYGRYCERHTTETHLIPNVLRAAAGDAGPVTIHGTDYPTTDGTCIRDYVHVEDLVDAHLLALEAAEPGTAKVFNLGSGSGFSVREVVEVAAQVTGRPIPAAEGPRRPGDPARLVASSARIREELGWAPRKESLQDMVRDAWTAMTA